MTDICIVLRKRIELVDRITVELESLSRGVAKLIFRPLDRAFPESSTPRYSETSSIVSNGHDYWFYPQGGPRMFVSRLRAGQWFRIADVCQGVIEHVQRKMVGMRLVAVCSNQQHEWLPAGHGVGPVTRVAESGLSGSASAIAAVTRRPHESTTDVCSRDFSTQDRIAVCLHNFGI